MAVFESAAASARMIERRTLDADAGIDQDEFAAFRRALRDTSSRQCAPRQGRSSWVERSRNTRGLVLYPMNFSARA